MVRGRAWNVHARSSRLRHGHDDEVRRRGRAGCRPPATTMKCIMIGGTQCRPVTSARCCRRCRHVMLQTCGSSQMLRRAWPDPPGDRTYSGWTRVDHRSGQEGEVLRSRLERCVGSTSCRCRTGYGAGSPEPKAGSAVMPSSEPVEPITGKEAGRTTPNDSDGVSDIPARQSRAEASETAGSPALPNVPPAIRAIGRAGAGPGLPDVRTTAWRWSRRTPGGQRR